MQAVNIHDPKHNLVTCASNPITALTGFPEEVDRYGSFVQGAVPFFFGRCALCEDPFCYNEKNYPTHRLHKVAHTATCLPCIDKIDAANAKAASADTGMFLGVHCAASLSLVLSVLPYV